MTSSATPPLHHLDETMATAGEVRLDPSAQLIAARHQAFPAIVAALEVGRKREACSSGLPFLTPCRNGVTPGIDHPAAHHDVSVETVHRRNNYSCGCARSTGSCRYAHDISRLCCRAGCNIDCGVDNPVCSRPVQHQHHPNHVSSRSERRYHALAHPASGSYSGRSASAIASNGRNCNASSYFTAKKGAPVVPSSARRTTVCIGIAPIQRVLQLGHGASQAPEIRVNKAGGSEQTASKIPRQHKVAGEMQEEEDGDGGASVVIGILSFESLRQGALAISSLFLTDETGKVRIVCVPVPPPSWLGEVVCISRWTITSVAKRQPASEDQRRGSTAPGSTRPASARPSMPQLFNCCLEVGAMFKLERQTWTPKVACQSIVVGHTSECLRVDYDADGINRDDGRDGGGGCAQGQTGRWSCVGWSDERPTLAEVTARGAVGLKAFTGRKGRGPVDLVARVVAVSPVIRVKNAPPFFMVEVEEPETQEETLTQNPPRRRMRREGEREGELLCSTKRFVFDKDKDHRSRETTVGTETSGPVLCRSPEEIEAIFAAPAETRSDSAGGRGRDAAKNAARYFPEATATHFPHEPSRTTRGRTLDEDAAHPEPSRAGDLNGSEGGRGSGDQQAREIGAANGGFKSKKQLMANLVLNGRRCLAWHPFLTPGKTFVFPAMGAFVLGGGKKMYRAFGDAEGASATGKSRVEGATAGYNVEKHIVEVRCGGDRALLREASGERECSHPDPCKVAEHADHGAAGSSHSSLNTTGGNGSDNDSGVSGCWEGGDAALFRQSCQPEVGSIQDLNLGSRESRRKDCSKANMSPAEGKEGCGERGRGQGCCRCVMTYEGEITGLAGQAGTYVLDGGGDRVAINLYLQHLNCSMLGGGLRRGALIMAHNVHPVYSGRYLVGLGACLRTSIQILRFSPLAENASYRPLVGGANTLPLAVHAWKYGFNAAFLRKEMPRRRNPSNSRKTLNETVSLGGLYGSRPSNELGGSVESGAGARGAAAPDKATLGHAPSEDDAGPTAKEDVDWGNLACSWVFGDSMRSKGLTKRYRTALRGEWFPGFQQCDAWKLFGPAYWDVYAEFLDHPPGVCAVVDPRGGGCLCDPRETDIGGQRGGNPNGMSAQEDRWDEDDVAMKLAGVEEGMTIQRIDEGWHGDVVDAGTKHLEREDVTSCLQQTVLRRPPPEAVLRAASRPLSASLEVAIEHAVGASIVLRNKTNHANGSATAAGPTSTFTVRTPFGLTSSRGDGLLGWLTYEGRSGTVKAPKTGAVSREGSSDQGSRDQGSRDQGSRLDVEVEASTVRMETCRAELDSPLSSFGKPAAPMISSWIEDRTDRVQIVLTRRLLPGTAVGDAVLTVNELCCSPSSDAYVERHGKKRARLSRDVEDFRSPKGSESEQYTYSASMPRNPASGGAGASGGGLGGEGMEAQHTFNVRREPALALIAKFAVCTEVVVLGAATTAGALEKPTRLKAADGKAGTGDGHHVLPSRRCATWGGASDCSRVVDGMRLLLRSYIVAEEKDVSILDPCAVDEDGKGSAVAVGACRPPNLPSASSSRHDGELPRFGTAAASLRADLHGKSSLGKQGGNEREVCALELQGAINSGTQATGTGIDCHTVAREGTRQKAGERTCRQLSVSEALVVRLANQGLVSGRGGASGSRIDPSHERESISVSGLLREVGFRLKTDGGGQRNAGVVRPMAREKGRDPAATSIAEALNEGSRGADMLSRLSTAKMQLCLTLGEGPDTVCVYLALCRASWPVGMVPGYSNVLVDGVCRKLSANGKSVYLAVARTGGGHVKVLSLALPPPPAQVAMSGSSRNPQSCRPNTPSDSRNLAMRRLKGTCKDPGCCIHCPPLILFPRRRRPEAPLDDGGTAGGDGEATCAELTYFGQSRGGAQQCWRGRGVISATRGGEPVLLDTHPGDASLIQPPTSPPPKHPPETAASGPAQLKRRQSTAEGKRRDVRSPRAFIGVSGGGATCSSTGSAPKHVFRDVWAADPRDAGVEKNTEACPAVSIASVSPSGKAAARPARAEPRWSLGDMCRRGVLVRAKRRFSCLSVISVRFVKSTMWCKSCGLIREADLVLGRCLARCDAATRWEVRWEGSANVDDGTGQALLLLDGDDVLKLLKLSAQARRDIETAARLHGSVSFSRTQSGPHVGNNDGALANAEVVGQAPPLVAARSALAAAAQGVSSSRGNFAATCVQVAKRAGGASGKSATFGLEAGAGAAGSKRENGGYSSVVVNVMGEGMETLMLPKLVLQGTDLQDADPRKEAYDVMARLRVDGLFKQKMP